MITRRALTVVGAFALAKPALALLGPTVDGRFNVDFQWLVLPGKPSGGWGWNSGISSPVGIFDPLPLSPDLPQDFFITKVILGLASTQPNMEGPNELAAWVDPQGRNWQAGNGSELVDYRHDFAL